MSDERGSWGSRPGFILAATGSAVGLGNIWGFPTQVGQGGGAAFVLVYLIAVVFICAPILLGEILIGRYAQLGPAGAVRRISPRGPWWVIGLLAVAAGTFILSFYAVIAGWTVQYLWLALRDGLAADAEGSGALFTALAADSTRNVLFTGLFIAVTGWCVNRGVRRGIEAASRLMMPLLFVLLVILAIRAVTLPGAAEGLAYYLRPDLSQALNPEIIGAAVGQAFFSLSLGMGALITYGSYLHRSHQVRSASMAIVAIDTCIALLAGFIIFPRRFFDRRLRPHRRRARTHLRGPAPTLRDPAGWAAVRGRVFPAPLGGRLHLHDLAARGTGRTRHRPVALATPQGGAGNRRLHLRLLHPLGALFQRFRVLFGTSRRRRHLLRPDGERVERRGASDRRDADQPLHRLEMGRPVRRGRTPARRSRIPEPGAMGLPDPLRLAGGHLPADRLPHDRLTTSSR